MMSPADRIDVGPLQFRFVMRFVKRIDQGLRISVFQRSADSPRELLRFDCFDERPHYHYDPSGRNERFDIDRSLIDDSLTWALGSVRHRLGAMLTYAGVLELAASWEAIADRDASVDLICDMARNIDRRERQIVRHKFGDFLIGAGIVTFGLEYFQGPTDNGPTIHVLAEVNGELIEVVCFDCYRCEPHYHYAPLWKNIVLPIDVAALGDPLEWALDLLKRGCLGDMLTRAGFPELSRQLDQGRVANLVESEIRPTLTNLATRAAAV